jgi:hypothetical protein
MVTKLAACFGMVAVLMAAFAGGTALAQADDANKILKEMSDYLGSQKNVSASFDTDIEVVTPEAQKIQFASSGHFEMSRPNKLRVRRTGGYADIEVVFDGTTATAYDKHSNNYIQVDVPGSVNQLVDRLHDKLGVVLPGVVLLSSSAYDVLTSDLISGAHIGRGVIDGVDCEHLAFRSKDTDWQIWIEVGDRPIPRKYVITSKAMAASPQYTIVIKDWKTDIQPGINVFVFTPPRGAQQLDIKALSSFDDGHPAAIKEDH